MGTHRVLPAAYMGTHRHENALEPLLMSKHESLSTKLLMLQIVLMNFFNEGNFLFCCVNALTIGCQ